MHGSCRDPVTGSAASTLCYWLSSQELKESGQGPSKITVTQGVEMGRRSKIEVQVVKGRMGGWLSLLCLVGRR